jgi:23S rRNA (uracil1939-C5)-methyltransferase
VPRRRKRLPPDPVAATIEGLHQDGRGIAKVDGKTVLVHAALVGERVNFRYTARRRRHDEGVVVEVLRASADRATPACAHYGVCGGCSLQHMTTAAQITAKQQMLVDALRQIGKVEAESLMPPLRNAAPWGYRRKARLGVKYVAKKDRVLVGFRERGSSFVADLEHCQVLHPRIAELLPRLARLIEGLSIGRALPQIEVAMDDAQVALIFRVLQTPSADDRERLLAFADTAQVSVLLQPGGPASIAALSADPQLHYTLPTHALDLDFQAQDFTQVNAEINRAMVDRAVALLQPGSEDQVLDLFCGIGNFSLPLARYAGHVVGVEGDPGLVRRARHNAAKNELGNVSFHATNLYEDLTEASWTSGRFEKVLLDPPRSGALAVLDLLPRLGSRRILYVSCCPDTLARDAGVLVHRHGYRLKGAGVMDMFPHTAHVEAIAWFGE